MTTKPSSLALGAAIGAACAAVLAAYAFSARSGLLELMSPGRAETYYNLLVRGFQSGHLGLARAVPPGLERLPDPYDPAANSAYRLAPGGVHDLSYFEGRLYLYFGVTPALILFWPFAAMTGHYLFHSEAAAIFCSVGFLTGVGILEAVRRRYFAEIGAGVAAAGVLALGLATGTTILLAQSDVYEVAIGCGTMLMMLAFAASWRALHEPARAGLWLMAAGAAFGLALGARPSLLPAAPFLAVAGWPAPSTRERFRRLLCAFVPVAIVGAALLLYNDLRFGRPLEFGQHYQLASDRQDNAAHFSPRYLGFNAIVYFLEPVGLTRHFPHVGKLAPPPLPAGHQPVEDPFGALADIPAVWLALAAPLAWRGREGRTAALRRFVAVAAVAFAAIALTLGAYYGSCSRYEAEFLPPLVLVAVVGAFGLERALAGRPGRRTAARILCGGLLAVSVAFNLLAAVARHAEGLTGYGLVLMNAHRAEGAIPVLERAVRLDPDLAEARNDLGDALARSGRLPEALGQFVAALRLEPDLVSARENFAIGLVEQGRFADAIGQFKQVLRLKPGLAAAHAGLAYAMSETGSYADATAEYEEAVRLDPGDAADRNGLGTALARSGRLKEAEAQFEAAIRLRPGFDEAIRNLAGLRALEALRGQP